MCGIHHCLALYRTKFPINDFTKLMSLYIKGSVTYRKETAAKKLTV